MNWETLDHVIGIIVTVISVIIGVIKYIKKRRRK